MKAGPKAAVNIAALPFRTRKTGADRFAAFCERFIITPKGAGARKPLRIRPWQRDLVGSVLDASPRPRLAGFMLPRGSGKTTLIATLGLYDLLCGEEGASVPIVAVNEEQAGIGFGIARRMVELNDELAERVQVYADRLYVPGRDATFQVLPAKPKALEGLDPTLAIIDELGRVDQEVYEVVSLAAGKREASTVIGIGTPPPRSPDDAPSVLENLRDYALEHPDDASLVWREHSAAGYEHHPVDCEHCWKLSNPAYGDFMHADAMRALLPPKTREPHFRRARLCQFVHEVAESWLPSSLWDSCADPRPVPDGAEVVLGLDGSFSQDCTALVVVEIGDVPHLDVVECWEPPVGDTAYRVPIADVEQAIRDACRRWYVREIDADPFRWARSLEALDAEGLPVVEYPQSPSRMTPATVGFETAVRNGRLTHSGDPRLARHVGNAVIKSDSRGVRVYKEHRHSRRRIDLAVAGIMAYSVAAAVDRGPQLWSFADAA